MDSAQSLPSPPVDSATKNLETLALCSSSTSTSLPLHDSTPSSFSSSSSDPTLTSKQHATNKELQTFSLFPLLPLELRLKVYGFVNNTPRLVTIAYKSTFQRDPPPEPTASDYGGGSGSRSGSREVWGLQNRDGNGGRPRVVRKTVAVVGRPRFVSRWVSGTPVPVLLGVWRESREEALKIYEPAFSTHEAASQIYFNFDVDTLYFGNIANLPFSLPLQHPPPPNSNSTIKIPKRTQKEPTTPAPYHLDLFLGGDYYGVHSLDSSRLKRLRLDVSEDLYGRRSFCWEDIRNLSGLEEVTLVVFENQQDLGAGSDEGANDVADGSGGRAEEEGPHVQRLMLGYQRSLRRVWDAYLKGRGEGVISSSFVPVPSISSSLPSSSVAGDNGGEREKKKEWVIPKIGVWNEVSGRWWGEVKLGS